MSEKIEILEEVRMDFIRTCCPAFPKPQCAECWTAGRKKRIENAVKKYGMDGLHQAFVKAASSPFLRGKNKRGWKANFDWIMKPENFQKIMEGNYDPQEQVSKSSFNLDEAVKKATFSVGKGC